MANFCAVQDVADLLRITINPADTGVLRAIGEASAVMQNYCRQVLELVADDAVTFDVDPLQSRLYLPELPVVSIASVVEDGTALVVTDDYKLGSAGILHRTSGYWLPGVQTVTVTYTHGHPCDYDLDGWPLDLRGVATRSAARALQAGLRAAETGAIPGVTGTTIGDYQVSFGSDAAASPGGSLLGVTAAPVLLRSEKEILDNYRYKRQA